MSWTCHGVSNDDLVDNLQRAGIVQSARVEEAMRMTDRGAFVLSPQGAYVDSPQYIGDGATISAPHMHAHCLELLRDYLKPGAAVLDVGSGSGYLTAAMAHMVCTPSGSGRAVGVDHMPSLVQLSIKAARKIPFARKFLETGQLKLVEGDGKLGYAEGGPYDCIHVGAAAAQIPQALVDQLKEGGRLVVPAGAEHASQQLLAVDKHKDGRVTVTPLMGVVYVPLTSREHQLQRAI